MRGKTDAILGRNIKHSLDVCTDSTLKTYQHTVLKKLTLLIAIVVSAGKMITAGDASKESYSTVTRHTQKVTRSI
jgi:hypothetical protein